MTIDGQIEDEKLLCDINREAENWKLLKIDRYVLLANKYCLLIKQK